MMNVVWYVFAAVVVAVMSVGSFFLYRRLKKVSRKADIQNQKLKKQMTEH